MAETRLWLTALVLIATGCQGGASESTKPAATTPEEETAVAASPTPPKGDPTEAPPKDPEDKTGETEVHPRPKADDSAEAPPANAFSCPTSAQEGADPLPYLRKLKGSEIILTPKGPKPPWQMIFSKDYVAVQGTASWKEDGLLAVCSGTDELILVDASNPSEPSLLTSLRPSAEITALEPKKGIAFSVLGSPFGGKEAPNKYGRCEHIARSGNTLYFSHRQDQFRHNGYVMAYDLSVTPPKRLSYRTAKGESYSGMSTTAELVAVAAHTSGLLLLGKDLTEIGRVDDLQNAWDVILPEDPDRAIGETSKGNNSIAYVADGKEGLAVIDISKPSSPRVLSRIALPGFAKKLAWGTTPDELFVALGPAGIAKISVKKKRRPRLLYLADTPGTAVDIAVNGDAVAVADWTSVRVFDATTREPPPLLAVENTGDQMGRALSVSFREDAIFVGDWTGVHILKPQLGSKVPIAEFDRGSGRIIPNGSDQAPDTLEVNLRNVGGSPLRILGGGTVGDGFSSTIESMDIESGAHTSIQISFDAQENASDVKGELVVCTDDPNAREMRLPLRANPSSFGPGKAIPDIGLKLTGGEKWKLSEHKGKPVLLAYFATF